MRPLAGGSVLPELSFLVHHAPIGLRLILCGRYAPGLQLAKMRVGGNLAELDATDLACATTEADAYLAKLGLNVEKAALTTEHFRAPREPSQQLDLF